MNIELYHQQKKRHQESQTIYRNLCSACLQPGFSCYCHLVRPIDPKISFVILIHPVEVRRRIASGRMSYLCLKNSHLISGQDFTENRKVNELIFEKDSHSVLLYPGINSQNLTIMSEEGRACLFPKNRKLNIFVVDGTWATARKMVRLSTNLNGLPRISFEPTRPSNFRVRKQPHPNCYSTIEAIHHTIELLGPTQGFDTLGRPHDHLLDVFNSMVELQLEFIRRSAQSGRRQIRRRGASSIPPKADVEPSPKADIVSSADDMQVGFPNRD